MKTLPCPIYDSKWLEPVATKYGFDYALCKTCEIVFPDDTDPNIIMTHNNNSEGRGILEFQDTRLQRVIKHLRRRLEKILDFVCGRGGYVAFLNERGIQAVGIDQYTKLKLADMPPESMDMINMVEVVEYLAAPHKMLRRLTDILKPNGLICIESSIVDFIGDPMKSD